MRKVIKISIGLVFSMLAAAVFVPLAVTLAMSVPAVQNAVGQRIMARFSKKLGTTVSFDRFEVRRLNHVRVDGLYVADYQGDTLLFVPHVEAPVEQLPLFGRPMIFGRVTLEGARMWIDRDSLGVVNIRQIVRRISDGKGGGNVYINGITARGITFALTRHDRQPRAEGVDFGRFVVRDTDVEISRLAVEGSNIRIAINELRFTERTGWRMDRLKGELLVGRGMVALDDVEIDSEGSRLRLPRLAVEGTSWRSFGRFADSVSLSAELTDSRLGAGFLRYFLPAADTMERVFPAAIEGLTASVDGPLSALAGRVERARIGGTELAAEFSSHGLPDLQTTEFQGVVSRFLSPGTDLQRLDARLADVGAVDFSGDFAGSFSAGVEVAGRLGVKEAALGKLLSVSGLSVVDGEFEIKAALGKNPELKAAGVVNGLAYRGRSVGPVEVDGEWRSGAAGPKDGVFSAKDGVFSLAVRASNPGAEWGLGGALSAMASGTAREFEAKAELLGVLYISPRGSVTTPRIELSGTFSAAEKTAKVNSEFADAEIRFTSGESGEQGGSRAAGTSGDEGDGRGGEVTGFATLKNTDELWNVLAPGLQVARGARVGGRFDTKTHEGEVDITAGFIEYKGVLLADARLETRGDRRGGEGGEGELTATLTAADLYLGALHIPSPRLAGRMADNGLRLTLDGDNYLTVSGLSTDSLHVDLTGFDLAALGGLTPRGTRVSGYVDVVDKKRIAARIEAKNMDAALLEPLFGDVLSQTTGLATLDVSARGPIEKLTIDGGVELVNLSSTVSYTGARYSIDHAGIEIKNSRATLPPTRIRDRFGGTGDLAMEVDLTTPADAKIALSATSRGLLAFDKTGAGTLGGRIFASGNVRVTSERMGTKLNIDAQTDPGTTIRLPLSGRSNAERADFVTFAAPVPPAAEATTELQRRLEAHTRRSTRSGAMSLEMTVRVTDAAEVGLTIDPRLGRGITARGDGVISLNLDPQGREISVTGDYTIRQGRMDLSMMDVLSKNFTIAPGSTIRWSGAPGDAALDVRASCRVRTSLAPLLGEGGALVSERANVPVDCVLALAGRLDEPAVTFDIELPSADTDQRSIAAEAMNTDELKSMQFLSLLVTGNFAGAGSIGAGTGASTEALASGSVGFDILTSQLGNLLSSDGYDVFFRYRPEDNFLTNRFDMGFAAGFAGDRLRLEIEGNYVDDRAAVSLGTRTGMGNLAGDVSLTWMIDEAGNLRLKVFSQTIDRLNETQGLQESGLGVYYRKDFDRLGDIFRRKRLNLPAEKTKKLK